MLQNKIRQGQMSFKMIQNAITAHCHRSDRPLQSIQYACRFVG